MAYTNPQVRGLAPVAVTTAILIATTYLLESRQATEAEVKAVVAQYQCKPTNDFVGRDAERLYQCSDGLKYTYSTFVQWAYHKKNGI